MTEQVDTGRRHFLTVAPELYRRLSEHEMKGEFGIVIEGRMRGPAGRTG